MPTISLVIPVRNEETTLGELVSSIRGQHRQPDEVLLVDGGSTDQTLALALRLAAADPRYRVIKAGEATPGRGRNVGIAAARHDWIALTDAGIRLELNWLAELWAAVERQPDVQVIYGNVEPVAATFFERCAALAYLLPRQDRPAGRMRGPSTASMLLHRDVWRNLGGFPNRRAAEDLIFMERIEQHEYKVGWVPAATVHWQLQPTLARTFRRFALYSKHNVWAGRQRQWHYGIARQYLLAIPFLVLAVVHSPWWLTVPFAGALARVAKSIWVRREGRGPGFLFNPAQFACVALILATTDLATFWGWAQALWQKPSGGHTSNTMVTSPDDPFRNRCTDSNQGSRQSLPTPSTPP
jgi:glycosyltransferase involved in cell wall biosynthesis